MTLRLPDFLYERLDEDEAIARAAEESGGGDWWTPHEVLKLSNDTDGHSDAIHIARHSPARVLREVEAKRGIIRAEMDRALDHSFHPGYSSVLLDLAAVYSDHPDYQQEWKP